MRVHWSTEHTKSIQCIRKQCGGAKFGQRDSKNLGVVWSCGCYLHETFRTAPLGIKWLEEWEKNKKLNDSLLSSYFCTCFPSRAVYIFIREFSTLLKVFGVFQDVGEKSLQTGEGKKKNTRIHICVVVIKRRHVSGCAVSPFVLYWRLQLDTESLLVFVFDQYKCIYIPQTKWSQVKLDCNTKFIMYVWWTDNNATTMCCYKILLFQLWFSQSNKLNHFHLKWFRVKHLASRFSHTFVVWIECAILELVYFQ